jgi:3-hydroxyisobutyrate dehydrogenase-like beta-hydroxyacid dehydrogenase
MRTHLVSGDPTGLQFTLANALKDLTYYNTMAEQAHADRTIAQSVADTLRLATAQGNPQAYVPELVERLIDRHK